MDLKQELRFRIDNRAAASPNVP
ncbi:MAG: hypothetical protein ACD_17C00414G0001, partial [uncultured bacterium]